MEGMLTAEDRDALVALKQILEMTDTSDWYLLHDTVRKYVKEGKLSLVGEQRYKLMVDTKLKKLGLL